MGAFEQRTATRGKLPEDVPDATEAASEHPDGAIYRSGEGDSAKRFRLRHARWVEVVARKAKDGKAAAKK